MTKQIAIANPADINNTDTLFLMEASDSGFGAVQCYVWADHFVDAFEVFTEWLDDNAPGLLTTFTANDYERTATEMGLTWTAFHDPNNGRADTAIEDATTVDHTAIGHTSLAHGTHIASDAWTGFEVSDDAEYQEVADRSDDENEAAE